ncbi:MAG: PQQ-binding-like beta-propeller repeat protein [Anaeromyxobacter sp.]
MMLVPLVLGLAVGATDQGALLSRLPPAPLAVYGVAWHKRLVLPGLLEAYPMEPGGVAVDPASGVAVFGTRDGWLHAMRPDGTLVWEKRGDNAYIAPPLVDGNVVYAATAAGQVRALELATGEVRWSYDSKEEVAAQPVLSGGRLFLATAQDRLFALDAKTGTWLWNHRREGKASGFSIHGISTPVVTGGRVYTSYSDGYVAALDAAGGQVVWERQVAPAGDYIDVDGLATDGRRLYAAAYSGAVLALDLDSGSPLWAHRTQGASRVVVAGALLVAVTATQVHGLDLKTGELRWTQPFEGNPGGLPLLAGRWLAVPAGAGGLRFLELGRGRTVRVFDPGSGISAAPGLRDDRLYVLSNGGDLFALDLK